MTTEKIDRLDRLLAREEGRMAEHQAAPTAKRLQTVREGLLRFVREAGNSGDLSLIVATEKAIVEGDFGRHANSPMMSSSLKTALAEIAVIENHIAIVDSRARYRAVDQAHSLPRNRKGGLPYDEARQALAGHSARWNTWDKARSDDDEKTFIDVRRAAFRQAGKLYIQRQAKTLGLTHAQADAGEPASGPDSPSETRRRASRRGPGSKR
jgi:hypothetical protein